MKFQKEICDCFKVNVFSGQKGYVLITTYILMAVLSVTTLASMRRTYIYTRDAERQKNAIIASEMAEGAIDKAITQLAASSSYTGTSYQDFSSGSAQGGYSITVTTPASNIRQIAVTGYAPGSTATAIGYKTASSNTYVSLPSSGTFTNAVFSKTTLSINGNPTIDSYISSSGAYAAGSARSNANVGSNTTAVGGISLTGSAITIQGAVQYGSGGTSSVVDTSGHPTITGGTPTAQTTNKSFTNPTTSTVSSGALSVSRGTTTLAAGTYNYSSLSVSASGSLATSGAVTIYVSGTVDLGGGGIAGASSIPANLKIYVTGTSAVSVSGNSSMIGVIYAPRSSVDLGGTGGIYGAVVGNAVTVSGNGKIHYDEDLASIGASTGGDPTVLTYIQTGNGSWTA